MVDNFIIENESSYESNLGLSKQDQKQDNSIKVEHHEYSELLESETAK